MDLHNRGADTDPEHLTCLPCAVARATALILHRPVGHWCLPGRWCECDCPDLYPKEGA